MQDSSKGKWGTAAMFICWPPSYTDGGTVRRGLVGRLLCAQGDGFAALGYSSLSALLVPRAGNPGMCGIAFLESLLSPIDTA